MSTKRIKFLKRKKILQKHVQLTLETNGPVKRFTIKPQLEEYEFDSQAQVVVEAKQLLETLRFKLGSVGVPSPAVPIDISRLKGDRVTFNLLVIDPLSARKLGSAEAIRIDASPAPNEHAVALLPVDASLDLEGVVWRIDYSDTDQEGHTDAPVLMIDRAVASGSASTFVQDSSVRAMVFPSAMREVLTKILLVDPEHDYDATSRSWRDSWIRFASRIEGDTPPEKAQGGEVSHVQDTLEWIDRATRRLARSAKFVDTYLSERGA